MYRDTRLPLRTVLAVLASYLLGVGPTSLQADATGGFQLATFVADVTCPIGHPLLGGILPPAARIDDPLQARGVVLLGPAAPVVICAVDWCEIRNRSYDQWRDALADAAGTDRQHVLFSAVHQHDAPLTDIGAAELLASVGLDGQMFDLEFERQCIDRTATALRESLQHASRVTHLGVGQAEVAEIASNRRVVLPDGKVTYERGSASGGNRTLSEAPVGLIDPWLRSLSFWDDEQPLAVLHTYATHPMSYYGRGAVSFDFVGRARARFERTNPGIFPVYLSGCSGDVTAGKYNDGAPANRAVLADRLHGAMVQAWESTSRTPLRQATLLNVELELGFHPGAEHTTAAMDDVLHDQQASRRDRILAAMGLATRQRIETGQAIDLPCLDLGEARIILFPGEAFVGYQLAAQELPPESFIFPIGYGECWPGYIPTRQALNDEFTNVWYWVGPDCDQRIEDALRKLLSEE